MRAFFLVVLVSACATGPLSFERERTGLLNGSIQPLNYDFGALRFERPEDFAALRANVLDRRARSEAEAAAWSALPISERPPRCTCELPAQQALENWVEIAASSQDRATWENDAEDLRERLTAILSAADALARGASDVDPRVPLSQLNYLIEARANAAEPRLRELFSRTLRDQMLRKAFGHSQDAAGWRSGLSERAEEAWRGLLGSLVLETDCSNTAWLQTQLEQITWFDRRIYGPAADDAAWLLIQHADRNPAFQAETLLVLERLASEGGTSASNLAYLWDRVAVADGRPQRFGTQMECVDGYIAPRVGLEAPESVEARRRAAGIMSYAQYRAVMAQLNGCADPG